MRSTEKGEARSAGRFYDRYWRSRCEPRTRSRSVARAALALDLLRAEAGKPGGAQSPRLLDIGCGPGWALEEFARAGYDASGLDVSPVAVEEARSRGLRVELARIEDNLPGGPYDVLVALEVLEHLADPLAAVLNMKSSLAGGGRLVISLPNEFHVLRRLQLVVGRSPVGGHDDPHLRHFDDRLARRLFDAARLRVLGRRSDGLVPPRFRLLRYVISPFVAMLPALFALSNVYLLAPGGPSETGAPS